MANDSTSLRLSQFEIDSGRRIVMVDGAPAKLGARAFEVLAVLFERRNRVVTKDELLDLVWPGIVVEENTLQVHIYTLRKLLGTGVIATIPGRGYQFTASLEPQSAGKNGARPEGITEMPLTRSAPVSEAKHRPAAPLFGRDDDLAALGALLSKHRLITVTGAGGVGKSRLAQALTIEHRSSYAGGVYWVELAGLSDPVLVPGAIASALGVPTASADTPKSLVSALHGMQVLIVLDNAEHLIEAVTRLVEVLLAGATSLSVVVTSQVPLKTLHERIYRLGPLAVPESGVSRDDALTYGAIELFVERACAADRRFELTEGNVELVVDLCRRLDGIALAIELAAARVPLFGVSQLASALGERMRLLTSGNRTAPPRQQTLRAAFDWSHSLLGVIERAVFRRLAVFAGSFSIPLARHVAAESGSGGLDEWTVVEALGTLVERSLVAVDDSEPPRYRLLESGRDFALERLAEAGEDAAWRRRHCVEMTGHFTRVAASCHSGERTFDDAVRFLAPDLDNAHEAMGLAIANDPLCAVALAPGLCIALTRNPPADQRRVWDATIAFLTDDLPASVKAEWAVGYARFWVHRRPLLSATWAKQAVGLFRDLGDEAGLVRALTALCVSDMNAVSDDQRAALAELVALERDDWSPALKRFACSARACIATIDGDFEAGVNGWRRTEELSRLAGDSRLMNAAALNSVEVEQRAGLLDAAIEHGLGLDERLVAFRDLHLLYTARANLFHALLAKDRIEEAREWGKKNWVLAERYEFNSLDAEGPALLAALEGRARTAATLLGFAAARLRADGAAMGVIEARTAKRASAICIDLLGEAEFELRKATGASLSLGEVGPIAFAAVDAL
jgi:predicted ATPase/DNA-binding winged helix-turn-helix (wHTH) protein